MYAVNFKKHLGISVILAAMLLSGCQKKTESSQGESADVSSAQFGVNSSALTESSAASSKPAQSISAPAESSVVSSAQPVESSEFSSEEEPSYSEPPELFPADRVYPDDELVPSEWLRVDSAAESRERVEEILKSDTSAKDPESTILALMNKNLLCFNLFFNGSTYLINNIDWDAPYDSDDFEKPLYPFTSDYFSEVQSIKDMVYDTYEQSVAESLLHCLNGEPRYTEINGQLYENSSTFPAWSSQPFIARSYVEITEKSDDKCTFIWHFPDLDENNIAEGYNQPESGYEFFYFKKQYTAEYIDGAWKLTDLVFDNAVGIF